MRWLAVLLAIACLSCTQHGDVLLSAHCNSQVPPDPLTVFRAYEAGRLEGWAPSIDPETVEHCLTRYAVVHSKPSPCPEERR